MVHPLASAWRATARDWRALGYHDRAEMCAEIAAFWERPWYRRSPFEAAFWRHLRALRRGIRSR
jgi:hypothetical protein